MPIVPMREILRDAKQKGYAVGSYNAYDLTTIRGILQAAEQEQSPVILCHAPVHFKFTPLESVANMMKYEAQRAKVPVALLLDHGYDYKTCIEAIMLGFNAVMMDASSKSFDENVAEVARVVKYAHAYDCDVEAELGHVTRPKSGGAEGDDDDSIIDNHDLYTNPHDAQKFIELTDADALAVAFGTAHGVYLKKPKLDLERLSEIRTAVDVPLVMHGGSGLSDDDFRQVVKKGVQKINYYTGMALYVGESIKEKTNSDEGKIFYHNLMMDAIDAVRCDVARSMKLFGSSNKV